MPQPELIDTIMTSAHNLIVEKGYENTLIADIAQKAGIAEGTIYRYFVNKRELFIKVAERWYSQQLVIDGDILATAGTWNKLQYLVWRTLQVTRQAPALSRFVLMELRPDPLYRESPIFALNRHFTSEVRKVVREAIANGEFRDDVSEYLIRDMVFGCIEHHIWAFLRSEGDFDPNVAANGIATVICRGMATTAAATDSPASVVERLERAVTRLEKIAIPLPRKAP